MRIRIMLDLAEISIYAGDSTLVTHGLCTRIPDLPDFESDVDHEAEAALRRVGAVTVCYEAASLTSALNPTLSHSRIPVLTIDDVGGGAVQVGA